MVTNIQVKSKLVATEIFTSIQKTRNVGIPRKASFSKFKTLLTKQGVQKWYM